MIGISKLYCRTVEASDPLRYARRSDRLPGRLLQFSTDKKPVVVWNVTRRCNLNCEHCYSSSTGGREADELTGQQGRALIDDLAAFGAPVLLLSGGEPLMRPDLPDLIAHARDASLPTVLSTNGCRITPKTARLLKDLGVRYVGISLDATERELNDAFRGQVGAFAQAMQGIANCRREGLKVGLRFTLHRGNADQIDGVFDLVEREEIPRVCFYHLVPSGRGGNLCDRLLQKDETRRAVDRILFRTRGLHAAGRSTEVLTVGNHADGPYVYLKLREEDPARAEEVRKLLRMNGGNSSGVGIACVSWDGTVYPDQFWRNQPVGSVRRQPFSEIWSAGQSPLLRALRDRQRYLKGRCRRCAFLDICNGNLRARAQALAGDPWGDDPACYLTDEERQDMQDNDG